MLTLQLWSPDTCRCQVHEGVEEAVYAWLPDEDGEVKQVELPCLDDEGNPRQKLKIYLTRAQAVDLHAARFIRGPGSTVRWRRFYLFRYLPLPARSWLRPMFHMMAAAIQPRSRLCRYHEHLGETQELYDTLREEQHRKNCAGEIAWKMVNQIADEDLQWMKLAYDAEESAARLAVLERVCPRRKIHWSMGEDRRVIISFPPAGMITAHMEEQSAGCLRMIQAACDDSFGGGRVEIFQGDRPFPGGPPRMDWRPRRMVA